jgi:hypothetical protein
VSRDFAPPFAFGVDIIRNKVLTEKPEDLNLLETAIEAEFQMVDENKNY